MKIISGIGKVHKKFNKAVIAIGVFDGIHRGHQQLIKKSVQKAKKIKGTSVVMTFWPHPIHVLRPEVRLPLLTSLTHRLALIERMGVDVAVVVKFTKKFSRLSPGDFIQEFIIKKFNPQEIFVGYDFRFGQDRSGNLRLFQHIGRSCGFYVNVVEAVKGHRHAISSTRIRELIANGQLYKARQLLGRPVSIMGTVVKGDGRGKSLGFPTANIIPLWEIIPPRGVYVVRVNLGKQKYYGMSNVGRRPSFKKGNSRINVEVHIFNFKRQIYNKNIEIEFIKKIRNEKAFNSKEQLMQQLRRDEKKARAILARLPKKR